MRRRDREWFTAAAEITHKLPVFVTHGRQMPVADCIQRLREFLKRFQGQ
jgi:hypothetical protein